MTNVANKFFTKLIVLSIILYFIFSGLIGVLSDKNNNECLAKVKNSCITIFDLQKELEKIGAVKNEKNLSQIKIQTLYKLINTKINNELMNELNIGIDNRMIADNIKQNKQFFIGDKFNQNKLMEFLFVHALSFDTYIDMVKNEILYKYFISILIDNFITNSDKYLLKLELNENQKVILEKYYFVNNPINHLSEKNDKINQKELEKLYNENYKKFIIAKNRHITYISSDSLVKVRNISQKEIQNYYFNLTTDIKEKYKNDNKKLNAEILKKLQYENYCEQSIKLNNEIKKMIIANNSIVDIAKKYNLTMVQYDIFNTPEYNNNEKLFKAAFDNKTKIGDIEIYRDEEENCRFKVIEFGFTTQEHIPTLEEIKLELKKIYYEKKNLENLSRITNETILEYNKTHNENVLQKSNFYKENLMFINKDINNLKDFDFIIANKIDKLKLNESTTLIVNNNKVGFAILKERKNPNIVNVSHEFKQKIHKHNSDNLLKEFQNYIIKKYKVEIYIDKLDK